MAAPSWTSRPNTRTGQYLGAKEAAIRERFDFSAVRYHQILLALLDDPEALAYAPQTVHRVRRLRDLRRAARRAAL
ncbi:MAG: DUF3263 domain-containing protein [Actinomycetota bacterium]|nr:DUF3263 domain-containing protein [Actinomycetota bacterium]